MNTTNNSGFEAGLVLNENYCSKHIYFYKKVILGQKDDLGKLSRFSKTRQEIISKVRGYNVENDDSYGICTKCPCGYAIVTPNIKPVVEVMMITKEDGSVELVKRDM